MFDKEYNVERAARIAEISPEDIDRIVDAWKSKEGEGYVIARKSGGFTYVSRREDTTGVVTMTVSHSETEPFHLQERAVNWADPESVSRLNNAIRSQQRIAVTEHGPGWTTPDGKNTDEAYRRDRYPTRP